MERPRVFAAYLRLWEQREGSDKALAQAFSQNKFVSSILCVLHRTGVDTNNWEAFCRVLATREKLESVVLVDDSSLAPSERQPTERLRPFLLALQQNRRIRSVRWRGLSLSAQDVCSFLDVTSASTIDLWDCDIVEPVINNRAQGARDIAVALQRNASIEKLSLMGLKDVYLVPILQNLGSSNASSLTSFDSRRSEASIVSFGECFPCSPAPFGFHLVHSAL